MSTMVNNNQDTDKILFCLISFSANVKSHVSLHLGYS